MWIDEKAQGIRACMKVFNERIRPLVIEGIDEKRIPKKDMRLYRTVKSGGFPLFYELMRVREKVTGRRWGVRR